MNSDNPYAPPESEVDYGRVVADAESYAINAGILIVKDGGILPDVCLKTGAVSGVLTRQMETFYWRSWWVTFIPILTIPLCIWLYPPAVPFAILIWIPYYLIVKQKVTVRYCLSLATMEKQKLGVRFGLGFIVLGLVIFILAANQGELLPIFGVVLCVIGVFVRRFSRFPKLSTIKEGRGRFPRVDLEALHQLERWRSANLDDGLEGDAPS